MTQPIDRLRARVLFYFAQSKPGRRRLRRETVTQLLELHDEATWKLDLLRALRALPPEVVCTVSDSGDVTLASGPPKDAGSDVHAADVEAVFEGWRVATGRTRGTILDASRRAIIESRLRDGYSVEQLVSACAGIMSSTFHTGDNDNGSIYTDLKHALKDAAAIEKFAAMDRHLSAKDARTERAAAATQNRRGRRHDT